LKWRKQITQSLVQSLDRLKVNA